MPTRPLRRGPAHSVAASPILRSATLNNPSRTIGLLALLLDDSDNLLDGLPHAPKRKPESRFQLTISGEPRA